MARTHLGRCGLSVLLFTLCIAASASWCQAAQLDTSSPANTGVTGLIDMPSARIIPDWNLRAYYTWADPYRTFGMSAGLLPRLEVNGRLTTISGLPALSQAYGSLKDKAIDVKFQVLDETSTRPAVAIGATDIHGNALFTSRYVVASKFFGPLDTTVGLGQGILAGEKTQGGGSSGSASQDAAFSFLTSGATRTRPFGGAEFWVTEDISLLAEYSSLDYETMRGITEVSDPGRIQINLAMRYRPWKNGLLSLSYLRGEFLGWSFSSSFPLKPEGMLPWKTKPFWVPGEDLIKEAREASNEGLALIVRDEVAAEGFSGVRASVSDSAVWLEIENTIYMSNAKAMGRACRAVADFVPERIAWLYISLKTNDIVLLTVKMPRKDLKAFLDRRMDAEGLLEYTQASNDGSKQRDIFLREEQTASPLTSLAGGKSFRYGVRPSWETLLNDPSGFFKNSFSLKWYTSYVPWAGAQFKGQIKTPLYNDISSSNKPTEPEPVRTDFVEYKKQTDARLDSLVYDQVFDLPGQWLTRAEVGLFEPAYGGVGGELFRFFQEGRWGLGLEGEWVRKRDIDNDFKFRGDYSFHTVFMNIYHKISPRYGIDAGLKLGRFLAGDWGGRLDISRTYRYFTLGGWYSITDTDVFQSSFNRGYNDKGVYIVIPFSLFTDHDAPQRLNYALSPWTRDPGQTVAQANSLYPMAQKANIESFERDLEDMRD